MTGEHEAAFGRFLASDHHYRHRSSYNNFINSGNRLASVFPHAPKRRGAPPRRVGSSAASLKKVEEETYEVSVLEASSLRDTIAAREFHFSISFRNKGFPRELLRLVSYRHPGTAAGIGTVPAVQFCSRESGAQRDFIEKSRGNN